jgi:hypothetical protein
MAVPYTFGSATSSIPLSQLDSNFATGITLGNTTVYLGNTTTSFGNVTLTNVTISSVAAAITPSQGGTGLVTIPANNVMLGNGTANVTVVAPGTTGNVLTSNGTTWASTALSAASVPAAGSTTQVQYNNAGAFAGSANLTFNGTTLTAAGLAGPFNGTVGATTANTGAFTTLSASSTVSGTGFSTYLASPPAIGGTAAAAGTFTTLTTSSTITDNGGTANGVTYLNGSKVLTSGSALYFDGTNLGVGVTPASWSLSGLSALQVKNASIYGYDGDLGLQVNAYFNSGFKYITTGAATYYVQSAGQHSWNTAASGTAGNPISWTQVMTLSPTGNLLIGTTANVNASRLKSKVSAGGLGLEITDEATSDFVVIPAFSSGVCKIGPTAGAMSFQTASVGRMLLDTSGNLGLGVTPSAWYTAGGVKTLQVGSASLLGQTVAGSTWLSNNAYFDTGGINKYIYTGVAHRYAQDGSTGNHQWFTAPSGTAGDTVSFTQAMTLDANGNLLVGTTSTNPTHGFVANNNGGNGFYLQIGHPTGTNSGTAYARFMFNQTEIGSITQSGTTAVLYNVTSDQRLKENIQDADSASSLIDSLQVRKFDWKADNTHQRYGFIAQELVTVAPEAVHQPEDTEAMMAVDYSKLVPMLVKEIQSLRQRVAQLETN